MPFNKLEQRTGDPRRKGISKVPLFIFRRKIFHPMAYLLYTKKQKGRDSYLTSCFRISYLELIKIIEGRFLSLPTFT